MNLTDEDIFDFISDLEPAQPVCVIDGAAVACLGYFIPPGGSTPTLVYCYDKLVAHYMSMGMTVEEAIEFVEQDFDGHFMGGTPPVVLRPIRLSAIPPLTVECFEDSE